LRRRQRTISQISATCWRRGLRRLISELPLERTNTSRSKKGGRWRLPYTRAERGMNDPFFESLKQVDIHAVFHFVNRQCQFMSEFSHVLHRFAGRKADQRTLTACILAWGTNMGLDRMAQISDIGYQALATTSNNFIRLETLQKANASVANAIAQLPIFQQYNLGGVIHSSSDGQKFETLLHTINARYSPKCLQANKNVLFEDLTFAIQIILNNLTFRII